MVKKLLFFVMFLFGVYLYIQNLTVLNEKIDIKTNLIDTYSKEKFVDNIFYKHKINNNKLKKHIIDNFSHFDKKDYVSSIENYINLYKNSFESLSVLKRKAKIRANIYFELHKHITKFEFAELQKRMQTVIMRNKNSDVMAYKHFFEGIVAELLFQDPKKIYEESIKLNEYNVNFYMALGNHLHQSREFTKAIDVFEKALIKSNFYVKSNKKMELLYMLGKTHLKKGDTQNASKFFLNLLTLSLFNNNKNYEFLSVHNLENNLDNLKLSLKMSLRLNNDNLIIDSMLKLAKYYYDNENYDNSKLYSLKSIAFAKKTKDLIKIREATSLACLNYQKLENTKYSDLYCDITNKIDNKLKEIFTEN
ncbi:MAG: hypothetical protein LBH46_01705 [Rickettsiales bacterium]|jgi:tetratricopeptide (TPR) repeat protein|nr:hypothetical protein [Rickettsiales bacterium]